MKVRFGSVWPALCLASFLPAMLGSGAEYVLCFREGGRLAIETANDGRCIPSREEGRCGGNNHEEGIHEESCLQCDACTDLPLTVKETFINSRGASVRKSDEGRILPQPGLQAVRSIFFGSACRAIRSAAPPPDLPVFSTLRSPIIRV